VQKWQHAMDLVSVNALQKWLLHCVTNDLKDEARKIPACWLFDDTISNVDVNRALSRFQQHVSRQGINVAVLTPAILNTKRAAFNPANAIYEQIKPGGSIPHGCTLQDVAEACRETATSAVP
jgi:arginine deiminase